VARASDILGERWTLLIVRDLLIAPRRFTELEPRLKGMGANLLAKRLKDMKAVGIIQQEQESPFRYALTEMGSALEPLVLALAGWGIEWLGTDRTQEETHFQDWDLLALKALFVPEMAPKRAIVATFADNCWTAWVRVDRKSFTFGLGAPLVRADIEFGLPIYALREQDTALAFRNLRQQKAAIAFLGCFPFSQELRKSV